MLDEREKVYGDDDLDAEDQAVEADQDEEYPR